MKIAKGTKTNIQSYKHNEQLHRVWKDTVIVDYQDNYVVTAHQKSQVFEHTGKSWYTKEPAICYFYDDLWYNVIVMFKKTGIYYYCNLSSPYLFDGESIKYIDYDLDVKVFPDGKYVVLDKNEYKYHSKKMDYPVEIKEIVEKELQELIKKIEKKEPPFSHEYVKNDYKKAFKDSINE